MARAYTEEEKQLIRECYATHSIKEIARMIRERFGIERRANGIRTWANKNGMLQRSARRLFSKEEGAFIEASYKHLTYGQLAERLNERFETGRTVYSIQCWLKKHGLRKQDDISGVCDLIEQYYGNWTLKKLSSEIQRQFGLVRSTDAIRCIANRMGLSGKDCQGLIAIGLAAEMAGIPLYVLQLRVQKGSYPVAGKHGTLLLDPETVKQIIQDYAPPPWPSLSPKVSARLLEMDLNTLHWFMRRHPERIARHKQCGTLHFKTDDVHAEMRRRGLRPPMTYAAS